MIIKRAQVLPFRCGMLACPKQTETLNKNDFKFRKLKPPLNPKLANKGCAQLPTTVWYCANSHLSDDEIAALPLIAAILPSPDPTGAQAMGGGLGIGKDIILDKLYKANGNRPIKLAILHLTRGYNFNKVINNELIATKPPTAAITYCYPYLEYDLIKLNPEKILLCGQEVINTLLPEHPELAAARRQYGLEIKVNQHQFPVQITFDPYLAVIAPVYLKVIEEDCRKLFEPAPVALPTKYQLLMDFDEVIEYLDYLTDFPGDIAIDLETENLYRKAQNKIATLQFATNNTTGVVIPYQHRECPFSPDELQILKQRLHKLFSTRIKSSGWVAHGAKFENAILDMHLGCMLDSADIYDTQAMAFLLDETRSERKADKPKNGGIYTLKQLALDYMNFNGYDQTILKARGEGALFDLPLKELASYGAMDSVITRRLKSRIVELAKQDHNYDEKILKFTKLFYGPITRLIAHIERTGFKTDLKSLRQLSSKYGPFETLSSEIQTKLKSTDAFFEANRQLVGDRNGGRMTGVMGTVPWVLDFDKPDHQALVFFKIMGLPPVSFSEKTGRPSIDDEFFEHYKTDGENGGHLEIDLFQRYNEVKKMRDTFSNKMMDRVDPATGDADCKLDQRIRPDIHYSRLVTGRFAMVNPNLGQIPRTSEGLDPAEFDVRKAVKDIFTVDRGGALLQVDYKVNEVRWAAIIAKDPAMAEIFINAAKRIVEARLSGDMDQIKEALFLEDIHRNTASEAFNVPIKQVTKQQRTASKAITFGILFQQSTRALAENIGVSEEEAETFQNRFFAKMTGVEKLIHDLKDHAGKYGFVETPHGRRRRFWSFDLPEGPIRERHVARSLRQCVNAPIQGIASDAAMYGGAYSLFEYIRTHKRNWLIQNVVHDSCLIQITDARETAEAILLMESLFVDEAQRRMEEMGVEFNLPLGIDIEQGISWGSLTKWMGTKEHAIELQEATIKYWAEC